MNLQKINYELFELTIVPLSFVSVGSLILGWFWTFADFPDQDLTIRDFVRHLSAARKELLVKINVFPGNTYQKEVFDF